MPPFDPPSYFAKRSAATQAKIDAIEAARQDKLITLQETTAQFKAQREALNKSWVGQLDLEPGSFTANRVNDAASLVSGASRLAGQVAALPDSIGSVLDREPLANSDIEAYNRYVSGKAIPGDIATMGRMVNGTSVFDRIKNSEAQRNAARSTANAFDLTGVVEQSNRKAFVEDLGAAYQANSGDIAKGWQQTKDGELLSGTGNLAKGLAGLIYSTGAATLTNGAGVREYIIENAPQLLVGAAGPVGKGVMAAGNIGYAMDTYQQGLENYAKANGGQLPPPEQMQTMALQAASLALAEQGSDMVTLGLAKISGKAAKDASKNAFKSTLKAAGGGYLSEAPTEAYQTYAEGEITGKPASGEEIFVGGAIGGASGGGLTGGVRGISELTGTTAEKAAERERKLNEAKALKAAAETGDVSVYVDPTSPNYAPDKAIEALFANSNRQGATDETKKQNLTKASEVVAGLQTRLDTLRTDLAGATAEGVKAEIAKLQTTIDNVDIADPANAAWLAQAKETIGVYEKRLETIDSEEAVAWRASKQAEIAKLETEIGTTEDRLAKFTAESQSKDVDLEVEAQKISTADPVASRASADTIINLSMANPDRLTAETAAKLAENTSLTESQRAYFRQFSPDRLAALEMRTMDQVSQDIYFGNDKDGFIGAQQYRQRIAANLASGDRKRADENLGMLGRFVVDHTNKAKAVAEAYATFKRTGKVQQVRSAGVGSNEWFVEERTKENALNSEQRKAEGALIIKADSVKLVKSIPIAAANLVKTQALVQAAYDQKFNPSTTEQANGNEAAKAQQAETQGSQTSEPARQSADEVTSQAETQSTEEVTTAAVPESELQTVEESVDSTTVVVEPEQQTTLQESTEETSTTSGVLAATQERAEEGASYRQLRFGDLFTQQLGNVLDGSPRPLVAVKDFISQFMAGAVDLTRFVKDPQVPGLLMQRFSEKVVEWGPLITSRLRVREASAKVTADQTRLFDLEDPIRYLIGSDKDVEENLKTAIVAAAFFFVHDQAGRERINGKDSINKLLGRDESTPVTAEEHQIFGKIGVYEPVIADSLGGKVLELMGFQATDKAGADLVARLRATLGGHVIALMQDPKVSLVKRTSLKNSVVEKFRAVGTAAEGMEIDTTNDREGHHFIRITVDDNKKQELTGTAKQIYDVMRGTQSFLQRLLGVESGIRFPKVGEPNKSIQKKTDAGMSVPKAQQAINEKNQNRPWKLNTDLFTVIADFSREQTLAMVGVKEITTVNTHADDELSVEATNDGLTRQFDNAMEFVGDYVATSEGGMESDIYMTPYVWNMQRAGQDHSGFDPQGSKIVRPMLVAAEWKTTIKLDDQATVDFFKLKVAEGFGIKIENGLDQAALNALNAFVSNPGIAVAIKAIQAKLFDGAEFTEGQRSQIAYAVEKGKKNLQTLNALIAYAQYLQAVESKEQPGEFTTVYSGGMDGVSNGAIANHILYGAAETADELNVKLQKGGIYTVDSGYQTFNVWKNEPGHMDTYETSAADVEGYLRWMIQRGMVPAKLAAPLWATFGVLQEKGKVTSDGRNLMKSGITPLNYGAGLTSIQRNVENQYQENIRAAFVSFSMRAAAADSAGEAADVQRELDTYVKNLNQIMQAGGAKPLVVGKPASFYMGYENNRKPLFTYEQIAALQTVFGDSIGKAATGTVKRNFKPLIARTKVLVGASKTAFDIYNAVRQGVKAAFIASSDIPTNKAGQPIRDLTKTEERQVDALIKPVRPVLHSAMSASENNVGAGLLMAKTESGRIDNPLYKVRTTFGTPLASGVSQMELTGRGLKLAEPGVGMLAASTQSWDASVSFDVQNNRTVQNNHDELVDGMATGLQTAKELNQAVWNRSLNYSPLREGYDSLIRMAQGILDMQKDGKLDEATLKSLAESVNSLYWQAPAVFQEALAAEVTKLEAMAQWGWVDQYAQSGGAYQVTDKDRQDALDRLASLERSMSQKDQAVLDAVLELVGPNPESEPNTDVKALTDAFGAIGEPELDSDADLVELFETEQKVTVEKISAVLSKGNRLNDVNKMLLSLTVRALKAIDPDLRIRYVTPETDPTKLLDLPKGPSRAWYVATKGGKSEVYVLSPDFVNSGLTAETLLHELVHAAIAQTIANPSKKSGAAALIKELETLRVRAQEYVTQNGLTQFAPAVADVQELVAWGMTNRDFQNLVLNQISVPTKTGSNRFIRAMQKFIDVLTQLLYRPNADANNGLQVLVSNTSGLFASAAIFRKQKAAVNQSQATVADVGSYTTQDIFQALDNGAVGSDFQAHLSNLLSGVVEKLHGPFGAVADAMRKSEAGNPMAIWLKSIETGKAPFASAIVASGFAGSAQEDFVMQQVEATVAAAIDTNEATTKQAYRELYKLYDEARTRLTPQDFVNAGFTEEDYKFVFDLPSGGGARSNYLSRFAAIGLGNERFAKMLQFNTVGGTAELGNAKSLFDRLMRIFEKVLNFLSSKVTNTFAGQPADQKLEALVEKLVDIEARRRYKIAAAKSGFNKFIDDFEASSKAASDKTKEKLAELLNNDKIKNVGNGMLRGPAAVGRVLLAGAGNQFMGELRNLRDYMFDEREGLAAGLLRELKGPIRQFSDLLRIVKHGETIRQEVITQTGSMLMKEFANQGKDLTQEQKNALTSLMLRTGAHNLLDHFDMGQLGNLLADPAALAKAIADFEGKLTSNLKDMHIAQAAGLGYYKATDRNGVAFLMKNAHVISRMLGTQFQNQITPQLAAKEEPIIAVLATLYAIKYSKPAETKLAVGVLTQENARTEGNGVEFLLKRHRELEKESLDCLFKGNPIQMIHGYTPEIYNPYVTIKVANAEEGKRLEEQGYTLVKSVAADKDVPDADGNYGTTQNLYILKDGGLNRRVSGVFSLTSAKAEGTTIHNGFINPSTSTGLVNASMQAEVTDAKLNALALPVNPRRDLSKGKQVNVSPVYDDQGNVVNWAYLMEGKTKDTVLERENRFEKVMGTLAGSVFDKYTSQESNKKVIDALLEDYEANKKQPWLFVEIGARSPNADLREQWYLLPEETRNQIKKVWGSESITVRKENMDLVFGYRKLSAADFLTKERDDLKGMQKIAREFFHTFALAQGKGEDEADDLAKRLSLKLIAGERGWLEINKEIKDILVVKNLSTLLGNIYSNASMLFMLGVKDSWTNQWVAVRGVMAYERDNRRLNELQAKLDGGYSKIDVRQTEQEIARIRDAIARNPVTKLVDAGLMPTIVEDVDMVEDPYSYKSQLSRKMEEYTNKVPEPIRNAANVVYMGHETAIYKVLSRTTQYSDFVARYALYQHLTTKQEALSHEDAIAEALETFVHYDVPMHPTLQYMDDMGFTPFMKYFFRVQRVLLKTAKDNPARVMGMVAVNNFVELGPIVLDSSFVAHLFNNPFQLGALRYAGTLDELLTVKAGMALLK